MSTNSLSARLTSLQETYKQTLALIHRLQHLPIQPGSAPSSSSSSTPSTEDPNDARVELGAEIHQNLKEATEELELLQQEVSDPTSSTNTSHWGSSRPARQASGPREQERERLERELLRLNEDLQVARSQFRKAQLQAKKNADAAKRKERELLF